MKKRLLPLTIFMLASLQAAEKPNIIYLMLDEWGYFESSGMGHEKLRTPNIDRFASEGMRFTQCLAGASVCGPTRSVLMTGKHQGRTTVRGNNGFAPLRADDVTIAELLKQASYATGGFGKWGIGGRGSTGVPEKHGFDTFFGYYHQVHAHSFYPPYLIRNSEEVPLPGNQSGDYYNGKTYAHHEIYQEAIQFIKDQRDTPFFCYLPWTPPHGLWGMPEDEPAWQLFKDKQGWNYGQQLETDARTYAAMLSMVDRQLGEIIALLKDRGLDDNTIIFLCGDNGGQAYFPSEQYPDGFFGPNVDPQTGKRVFRGGKGQMYEGGLRIPMLVRWPGKIQAGSVSDHLCSFPDIMPTLCELTGVSSNPDSTGISILPTLLGKPGQKQHKYLYWEQGDHEYAVRMDKWKLVKSRKAIELFNLETDLIESRNIANRHPDIVARLQAFAQEAHTPMRLGTFAREDLNARDGNAAGKKPSRISN